jgi:hypothetical protein
MCNVTRKQRQQNEPTELSALTLDGMVCRFVLDDDGSVRSFTIERSTTFVDSEGVEVDGPLPPGEAAQEVSLGEPITARALRRFRFEETLSEAKRQSAWWSGIELADARRRGDGAGASTVAERIERIERLPDGRRGRPGLDDRYYAEVAQAYVRLIAGGSTAPVRDLAGEMNVADTTARNHVREARRRGILTKTERGKLGGVLTARAIELLNEGNE